MMNIINDPRPMLWWWLSLCDADAPEGSQFVCCIIAEGRSPVDALRRVLSRNERVIANPPEHMSLESCQLRPVDLKIIKNTDQYRALNQADVDRMEEEARVYFKAHPDEWQDNGRNSLN